MAMKQTQTKLFDFADVGLDFSAGSKNLFPDRFKKMLSLGYNQQTVSSVSVVGDQVTLTYGGAHGYVADRVLKVDSGALASINGGEFWIDSVTTNTVTMTIDAAPSLVPSGFITRIASLGYELVYEVSNIHVYKFKAVDDTDLFLRLCFQTATTGPAAISPCVGRAYDNTTSHIIDDKAYAKNANIAALNASFLTWMLQQTSTSTPNNYTYTQGFSSYGKACMVGSPYHIAILTNGGNGNTWGRICGMFPGQFINSSDDVFATNTLILGVNNNSDNSLAASLVMCGNKSLSFESARAETTVLSREQASHSFYPDDIEPYQVASGYMPPIFDKATRQYVGHTVGGLYVMRYGRIGMPTAQSTQTPFLEEIIDSNCKAVIHHLTLSTSTVASESGIFATYLAFPVEELKID